MCFSWVFYRCLVNQIVRQRNQHRGLDHESKAIHRKYRRQIAENPTAPHNPHVIITAPFGEWNASRNQRLFIRYRIERNVLWIKLVSAFVSIDYKSLDLVRLENLECLLLFSSACTSLMWKSIVSSNRIVQINITISNDVVTILSLI